MTKKRGVQKVHNDSAHPTKIDTSMSGKFTYLILAIVVLFLGLYAINNFEKVSVGKAYEILLTPEAFTERIDIDIFSNVPFEISLTVNNAVKNVLFGISGSGRSVTVSVGNSLVFTSDPSDTEILGTFDATSEINNFCEAFPCKVPITLTSESDGTLTLSSLEIELGGLIEEVSLEKSATEEVGITAIEGEAWQVGTAINTLELSENLITGTNRESIALLMSELPEDFIDKDELPNLLKENTASNSKGDELYTQRLYFEDVTTGYVQYLENFDDITADFLYFQTGKQIARYELEFTTPLKSDVDDSTGTQTPTGMFLTDFELVNLEILGKNYTILEAKRLPPPGNNIQLFLMGGAVQDTLLVGETKTYTIDGVDWEVALDFVNETSARFSVNGESTSNMQEGDIFRLSSGKRIGVSQIVFQDFAGGVHSAEFFLGAQRLELLDSDITDTASSSILGVNEEFIEGANVIIEGTDDDVLFTINKIIVDMTAQDDYYIPANSKLSENPDLDEPELLFTRGWDIAYEGLSSEPTNQINIKASGSDDYELEFTDGLGNIAIIPLAHTPPEGGIKFGDNDDDLIVQENKSIQRDDYFIVTDEFSNIDGKRQSFALRYRGADRSSADNPFIKFDDLGTGSRLEGSVVIGSEATTKAHGAESKETVFEIGRINFGGLSIIIYNYTTHTSNDFEILVDMDFSGGIGNNLIGINTQYGASISIRNDTNPNDIIIRIDTPDANDFDNLVPNFLEFNITNSSGEVSLSLTADQQHNFITPEGDDFNQFAYTSYGAFVRRSAPTNAPQEVFIEYPQNQRVPLVFVIVGETFSGEPVEVIACETTFDCPLYNKCEAGVCVGFCAVTPEDIVEIDPDPPASGGSSVKSTLNDLGYDVTGEADLSEFTVSKSGNEIKFTSDSAVHIFDQELDSFVFTDAQGEVSNVRKRATTKSNPSHIVEFREKPLLVVKTETEREFRVKPGTATGNIKKRIEARLSQHKQRLADVRASAIEQMIQVNPGIESKITSRYEKVFNGVAVDLSNEEVSEIKALPSVKNVFRNDEVRIVLEESVNQISADELWEFLDGEGISVRGQGITIGIIDTGVDYTHPDLGGCFGSGCKVIGGFDFINNDDDPMDDHGHGTHVAATAAGNGVLLGVAPEANIVAYKVLSAGGSGSSSGIIDAIERSVDPNQDGNFDDHLDVISLSLGGGGDPDDPMSQAIDNAVDAGIVAVIAAGNSGPSSGTIGSPGTSRKAITIGAVSKCDIIADFSSRGPVSWSGGILLKPDLMAPGVSICAAQWEDAWASSQCIDTEHTAISGTSMATPHVSGAAALLIQAHPEWTPDVIKSVLMATSFNIGLGVLDQGAGRMHVGNANNAEISTSPQSLAFEMEAGELNRADEIIVKNLKDQEITVDIEIVDLKDEAGTSYDFAFASPPQLTISENSEVNFNFVVNIPNDIEGRFTGKIIIQGDQNYVIPFVFEQFSELTLKAVPLEGKIQPSLYVHNEDLTVFRSASFGFDFSGDNFTFKVPSGNYSVYAMGEFGSELEYILMDMVEVEPASDTTLELRIADARPFTVKAESLQGVPLILAQWSKEFLVYNNESLITVGHHDPLLGDQLIYISDKPDNNLDTDIMLYLQGVPARAEDLE